jgi:hypothetical protein
MDKASAGCIPLTSSFLCDFAIDVGIEAFSGPPTPGQSFGQENQDATKDISIECVLISEKGTVNANLPTIVFELSPPKDGPTIGRQ